ncbi:MAG: HNH endonuclease [Snowella sp.]|jgi:hypothetical protein|nr:MAG: HNH endonuclease [Snowella sp.]
MSEFPQTILKTLYKSSDINRIWRDNASQPVICHPQKGWISPNKYREIGKNRPCPYCAKKMVYGKDRYSTPSLQEAVKRGYEYLDNQGIKKINQIGNGNLYFHPNYVTLDHKINKARCPELMFNYDNLEIICWKCNNEKSDNNAFELQFNHQYINDLIDEVLSRYPSL